LITCRGDLAQVTGSKKEEKGYEHAYTSFQPETPVLRQMIESTERSERHPK
jgi:hypothetical protein